MKRRARTSNSVAVPDVESVAHALRSAAEQILRPRFRSLEVDDIWEKAPGEIVTIADQECEAYLGSQLVALMPGSVVLGEEATSENPAILDRLTAQQPAWLLDPLDGTSAFAAGSSDYAVMAALVVRKQVVLAVIHHPEHDRTYAAELGAGAYEICTGTRLSVPARTGALEGAVMTRFLPPQLRATIQENEFRYGTLQPRTAAAGFEYPAIACGDRDFMLYWRTLPWDHAPGALILSEAGGVAAHLDGSSYVPTKQREGLLIAVNRERWCSAKEALHL
ncbi:inositol monophosphatase family protein [Nocardioides sp. CN2-186]|uniref:inositol monophosphatase family protein n=1 Tax=Nocardioides tweenelious TaxID=3156607 RepID=UPI0032B348CD